MVLGEGVELPGRVPSLRDAMQAVIDDGMTSGLARAHAFVMRGWASWLLGHVAGARADLALVTDEDPNVESAGQLLQFIDIQQGR